MLSLLVRFNAKSSVIADSIYRVLLGRSLVVPLALFLWLAFLWFLNSLTATTSLKSELNEFIFCTGLREAAPVGILPEMKELEELCRGALFDVFL